MPEPPEGPVGARIPRWAYIGGAVILGIVGVVWWRHRSSSTSNTNTTSAFGSPMPGQGLIEPILINQPAPSSPGTGDTDITPPPSTGKQIGTPTRSTIPSTYQPISKAAALILLTRGDALYQSGAEGIAWAKKHGRPVNPTTDPNKYYQLSPTAAREAINEGMVLFQSPSEARYYAQNGQPPRNAI